MTFPVLPKVDSTTSTDINDYAFVGKVLVPFEGLQVSKFLLSTFPTQVDVLVDASDALISVDQAVEVLNSGVQTIFISDSQVEELIKTSGLPSYRFGIKTQEPEKFTDLDASLVVSSKVANLKAVNQDDNRSVYFDGVVDEASAIKLAQADYIPIISTKKLTKKSDTSNISVGRLLTSTLTTDRPDGLFTTLITSGAPSYTALGVVYSSEASILESIATGEGVYQSRKRREELWYKGKTSGATQRVISISKDCDSDVVKFVVEQRDGFGFCHKDKNYTCFNDGSLYSESTGKGLGRLDHTLVKRKEAAPEGSYTKRLFNDEELLVAKLKEELDELIEAGKANDKQEIAWEAADLIYFVMVWCVKNGVRLSDIEKNLDIKDLKVTRRKGDAKAAYLKKPEPKEEPKQELSYKLTTITAATTSPDLIQQALTRPNQKTSDIMKLVLPIIKNVQENGDKALLELTAKFDGVQLESPVLNAPFPPELMQISEDMKEAIDLSMKNIETFHAAQLPKEEVMSVETAPGVVCSRFAKPIENVGLYVPGGTAVLPSTAMMLGVPAKVAGCKNIVIASPPARATGKLTPEVVYVAHKLGASSILMAGGAQAVTAMAYGTDSVVKCDKILGPGNQFVTAAKMYVQNDTQALCSIDMPAGPSEVLVIADSNADPDFVASDLLSQAEHGVDSQVILIGVGLSTSDLAGIEEAVATQASVLPRREIVSKCLAHSYTLLVDTYEEAFKLSNDYAPEHLILQIEKAGSYVPDYVDNAGSVFVGKLSPESCGDYSSGTNHTLPTYGYARQYSGVNTATFQKFITSQEVSEEGLKSIGKAVMTIAAVEGLEAHRNAVHVRMEKLGLL
ncbi:trifunctional histidinol dehydrogenase [Yamadazyma tenuis]|uniref:Histidine biosynthesis trifunctional protein n=1 Tax=Candida tenuis (strain ATCC 10573 / BCRC 21748 / CBS 615 / JCM 9827 / NBRC 10315 / NRRL Y-1498 / VKM Y-70) TaxID=590646 RepID=G3B7S2_CANTC|nr:histidine biosynthesis trifunctional-protein [Yamadazyma tenuis ATCC 10573]EGV62308.1 histidine biosynthesis trifunctional-protein [Yamadazyma tenuis ATCC 10573]WEJ93566.1 trifunctional histidinol dehydrogenase [Yamadazyma tenuis]